VEKSSWHYFADYLKTHGVEQEVMALRSALERRKGREGWTPLEGTLEEGGA